MELKIKNTGEKIIIFVVGTVDLYTSPELREEIQHQIKNSNSLIVDLNGVDYMDSSGIATLVEGLQVAKQNGKKFALSRITPKIRDVFSLARLEKVFTIYEELEE